MDDIPQGASWMAFVVCFRLQGAEWGFDRDDRALQGMAQAVQDLQDCDDRGAFNICPRLIDLPAPLCTTEPLLRSTSAHAAAMLSRADKPVLLCMWLATAPRAIRGVVRS